MPFNVPGCDGGFCRSNKAQELRRLPTGGEGAAILCQACYQQEMGWRRDRNKELDADVRYDLPTWESLEVYNGAE